ncbi:MAG: protein phosphatase 2C domain-containing protein [Clostridia bacterium]|nr:protein phosphatase 2C domain-containing protein [Clostridia bacterium]
MNFLSAFHTDIGTRKSVNQDALMLKHASTPAGRVVFAVLCDGMGGLKMGEMASAFVINAFAAWFDTEMPAITAGVVNFDYIRSRWDQIVRDNAFKIMQYGAQRQLSLGTTLTALLIVENSFICAHVGDSRIYRITTGLEQLTKDHSLVQHEVEQGRLTPDQAKVDSRRNVLLQCIGASKKVAAEFLVGQVAPGQLFMLCSDGFHHELTEQELVNALSPSNFSDERTMKNTLISLVDTVKQRGETDNISVITVESV